MALVAAGNLPPPRTLSVFDNLQNHLAISARGDRVEDRANRFRSATLFAYDQAEVLFRHTQFEHRGSVALRLLHVHRVRVVHQLLCEELNELLHWIAPMRGIASSGDR